MARSTCNPDIEVPKGMMRFEVIRSTIRDSIGQYCAPGDFAVLTKKDAQSYLTRNWIRVALPEFDTDGPDESDTADSSGEDSAERAQATSDTGGSAGEGRTRRPIKR